MAQRLLERWRVDRRVRGLILGQLGRPEAYGLSGNEIERRSTFDPSKETVLLTQGLVHTRGVLDALERRLRRDGYEVFSIHLGGLFNVWNTWTIPRVARRLITRVRRLRARHQLGRIHMVGHSKGGLIGRYMVQMLGGDEDIRTLITLGTPHQGTPTAHVVSIPGLRGLLPSGPEMLPDSELLQRLNGMVFPERTRLVSIFSRTDLVCPFWCSELTSPTGGRVRNLMVHGQGHTDLLHDLRVYRLLRAELRPPFEL